MSIECPIAPIRRYRNVAEMEAAYPDSIRLYESDGVILLEDSEIAFDQAFVATLTFPKGWKKIGTKNGITETCVKLRDGQFVRRQANPLAAAVPDNVLLLKTYSELVRLELGFKLLISRVFPTYGSIDWDNCTFRFTRTEDEPRHLDSFGNGVPLPESGRRPRAKFFLNVDSSPRIWMVGPTLRDILKASAGSLGKALPSDLNALCHVINTSGILDDMPAVRVEIPPRGVVFANGATVLHQIVYGERMVALEGFVAKERLQPDSRSEWDAFPQWIGEAGYALSAPTPVTVNIAPSIAGQG